MIKKSNLYVLILLKELNLNLIFLNKNSLKNIINLGNLRDLLFIIINISKRENFN